MNVDFDLKSDWLKNLTHLVKALRNVGCEQESRILHI